MAIDLSALSTRQALTAIYIGYYDRAADPAGIQFWEQVVANTSLDLVAITDDFAGQAETQAVHPFFADPATSSPAVFITSLYQNLFNRDPDAAGLTFWSNALQDAIDGVAGAISVGQIITSIIEGAVDDADAGTFDRTTILNKIEVGLDWTEAAEAAGIDYSSDADAQASAKSIIEGVTDDAATVAAAKATTDDFFAPEPVPGNTILLTSATDAGPDFTGTENDDEFLAYIQQNPFAGGVSNSLSSADRLDGGAGDDRLYAELTKEFVGVSANTNASQAVDIQPRVTGIEEIDIEARDDTENGPNSSDTIIVDAKHITDHVEIGSFYSDGDLVIENLTTLTGAGTVRNTSDITITMDHTDNFNSDGDASDLTVYFDNDYLVSGQVRVGTADFFLLDQDAELRLLTGQTAEGRLDEIDKNGIRFEINGQEVVIQFDGDLLTETNPDEINDHDAFIAALQAPLADAIAAGLLPAGTEIVRFDYTGVIFDENGLALNRAGLQDGSFSDLIPSIRVISGDGSPVTPLGFTAPDEITGEFNVFGRFDDFADATEEPISVDIDLHKAGRGSDGGDLIIGGKAQEGTEDGIADGIEVFNISVSGGGNNPETGVNDGTSKPSNLGTITSTGNELRVINIVTDPAFVNSATHASLTVRNGFDQSLSSNIESGDLELINANGFLGDLTLGVGAGRITNLDTLLAQGGGDVSFQGLLDGTEPLNLNTEFVGENHSYTTGSGDDTIDLVLNGDGLDYSGDSVTVNTNEGDDFVNIVFTGQIDNGLQNNNQLNQVILDAVNINTGTGSDAINVDGIGNTNINAGAGNDSIFTDGTAALGTNAVWAFNFDDARAAAQGLSSNAPEDLPGVQTSLAYIGGASITVTLSGAGIGAYADGGGIMSQGPDGAVRFDDGYESIVTINGTLNNGNTYYGDQTDINAAILRAINDNPVLGQLLTAFIGANNTLVVASNTSGNFDASDLKIEINQRDADSTTYANAVLNEARELYSNSAITLTDLWGTTTFSATSKADYIGDVGSVYGADLNDNINADMWYDGLSVTGDTTNANSTTLGVNNLHTLGSASVIETDNVINGGADDDLIVLSTDAIGGGVTPFSVSSSNAMMNGASNETIELTGPNFGEDTVMNFTDDATEAGVDFIDLTAYLTSLQDISPNTGSADTSDSHVPIPVTLATDTTTVAANEVSVITFDPTSNATWEGLGAAQVAALFNNSGTTTNDYDGLDDDAFSVAVDTTSDQVVGGASKAVVMIENADNDGEYRLFELTWNSSDTPATQSHSVTVVELGELDFGDSLANLSAANLVGSTEYSDLLAAFPV